MVFHLSVTDRNNPRVSKALLIILDDLENAVVWTVSTCLLISWSSPNLLDIVPSTHISTISTLPSCSIAFFSFLVGSCNLSPFALLFLPCSPAMSPIQQVPFWGGCFSLCLVVWPRLCNSFLSQNPIYICVPHSPGWILFCIYHLFSWSNFNFLHNSQWITFPTKSCRVLYSFCANLLDLLIIWLIISSLSQHTLHLLFTSILSIFVST